jgi:hypothetical protein
MRESIIIVLIALLAACTGPTDRSALPAPHVETTPRELPPVIPAEALPVPEPSPWPIKPEEKLDRPTSSGVAIGRERPFELYSHCGIDFRVDFDGSFWQSYIVGKASSVGDPFQKGRMTLLSGEVAVFRFESQGDESSIYFIRNDAPKPEVGCD